MGQWSRRSAPKGSSSTATPATAARVRRLALAALIAGRGVDAVTVRAAFRDPDASVARIGFALVWKHAFARAAVIYVLFAALAPAVREGLARALVAMEAARACLLVIVLYVCGDSFWTSLRVIGDLPHPLIGLCVAAGTLVLCARLRATAAEVVV